jgi:hypothetical protein
MAVAIPETRYAKTPAGVYLAYQTAGDGPMDLVWQFDLIFGNVEDVWGPSKATGFERSHRSAG